MTAKLLAKRRNFGPAEKILRQRVYSLVTPAEIVMALERARVAEAAGRREIAASAYLQVVRAWARGDPELQEVVRDARERARRLGGS